MKSLKNLKICLVAILGIILSQSAIAQLKVGNNPTTLNSSAALEVESSNKGFLPPRVALTSTTDVTTIPSPAAGLLVINTVTAGSGNTAVVANTLYIWNGTQWDRIVTNSANNNSASNPFVIGEIRSVLVACDVNNFTTNGGSRIMMNGKGSNNTTTVNRKSASETAIFNPSHIVFRGLRMDFLEATTNGEVSPKLYNTTPNPITYNLAALSTYDTNINGAGTTIAGNAYSFNVDGNDSFGCEFQGRAEYVNAMVSFPDGEWYLCTWHAVREATNYNFYMTVQRLN